MLALRSPPAHQKPIAVGVAPHAASLREPSLPAETLTEREIEVLRLFAAGLTNAAIARRLFVSQNTIKWYAKKSIKNWTCTAAPKRSSEPTR